MVIFGGTHIAHFSKSIIEFDITLMLNKNNYYISSQFDIKEKKMQKLITNYESEFIIDSSIYDFGFECIKNGKNETYIILIGGKTSECMYDTRKSIIIWNYNKNEIYFKENILPISSPHYPATIIIFRNYIQSLLDAPLISNLNVPNELLNIIGQFCNELSL